ncbi:MAG: hypothetical protein AAF389_10545 [Gemmatimonadota bacterium]
MVRARRGRGRRLWGAYLASALVIGCGQGVGLTEHSGLTIDAPEVITLSPSDSQLLAARHLVRDGEVGDRVATPEWTSSDPDVASVDERGVVLAHAPYGHAWIRAESDGWRDSITVAVQPAESTPSSFEITLHFAHDVPQDWRDALTVAKGTWERVIRRPLPEVEISPLTEHCGWNWPADHPILQGTEDGVRIMVTVGYDFPEDTYVEAVGGPCIHRGLPWPTTVVGTIVVNADKFGEARDAFRWTYLAHHEMGHTFGLAGVIQGFDPPYFDGQSGAYRGRLALWGFKQDTGRLADVLFTSNGSHWQAPGVMGVGSWIRDGPNPTIGSTSIGSLMDLGYPAAWYGAGQVPDVLPRPAAAPD